MSAMEKNIFEIERTFLRWCTPWFYGTLPAFRNKITFELGRVSMCLRISPCCRVNNIVDDQILNDRNVGRIGLISQRAEAQAKYSK